MTRVLVIDRGNASAKGALIEDGKITASWWSDGTSEDIEAWIERSKPEGAAVSSVVPEWNKICRNALRARGIERTVFAAHDSPWPFSLGIENQETVGPDRLCAAAGVIDRGFCDAIIVDAGSAVTVDILRRGVFEGGAIMPGIAMMLKSLSEDTAALPLPKIEQDGSGEGDDLPPGRDTMSAISSGVLGAFLGGIQRLVHYSSDYFKGITPEVFLTGGNARFLTPSILPGTIEIPFLVLEGLNCIYKRTFE